MRSEQIHVALHQIPNRFALCGAVSRATHILHKGQTRTEDTMTMALNEIGLGRAKTVLPETVAPPEMIGEILAI